MTRKRRLTDAYGTARPELGTAQGDATDAQLENSLERLYSQGRAAHPRFSLSDEDFAAHLALCGAEVDCDASANGLRVDDLFLAAACVRGDPVAVAHLVAVYKRVLTRYLRHLNSSAAFVDEVAQRLWDKILVATAANVPPRLATYSGHGPLAGWIGVGAQRVALTMLRDDRALQRGLDAFNKEFSMDDVADLDLNLISQRYGAHFQRIFHAALAILTDRERTLFRQLLFDGLTMDGIADRYGVNRSTISRWLTAAREKVAAEVLRRLRDELQLSHNELPSMTELFLSHGDLNISAVLGAA